jgi:hypothetical protein
MSVATVLATVLPLGATDAFVVVVCLSEQIRMSGSRTSIIRTFVVVTVCDFQHDADVGSRNDIGETPGPSIRVSI